MTMNINDVNEASLAIADIYNVASTLAENVSFQIEITPKYNTLEVAFIDRRNEDEYNIIEYKYNKDLSIGLNGICLKEFVKNKNLI